MKNIIIILSLAGIFSMCSTPSVINASTSNKNAAPKPNEVNTSLVFPVAGNKSNIGSFWGDGRDGGKRKHEGIDIFAQKGTEVVAVFDGEVVAVANGGIGGKTIWLQADDYSWTAYHAHLDTQFVFTGDKLEKGRVIGSVGNTGNAQYTPAHLHFGLYTYSGAIDPLPYVKSAPKVPSMAKTIQATSKKTGTTYRVKGSQKAKGNAVKKT